jgi:hypothetical protein
VVRRRRVTTAPRRKQASGRDDPDPQRRAAGAKPDRLHRLGGLVHRRQVGHPATFVDRGEQ